MHYRYGVQMLYLLYYRYYKKVSKPFSRSLDAEDTAAREMKFFFPEFCQDVWYKEQEPKFRKREVMLDDDTFVHRLV